MGNYEKPVITVDAGMAEGIYASSGAQQITVSAPTVVADWGNNNGQLKFTIDLSACPSSQLTVVLTFNSDITNAWGAGSNASYVGNTANLYWYDAPKSAEIFIQVDKNLSQLQCTGSSYSNK